MPKYLYLCSKCQHSLEVYQKFSENPLVECPNCNCKSLERAITGGLAAFVANRSIGIIADKNTNSYSDDYKSFLNKKNKTKKKDNLSKKLKPGQKLEKPTPIDPEKAKLNKKINSMSIEQQAKYIETGKI